MRVAAAGVAALDVPADAVAVPDAEATAERRVAERADGDAALAALELAVRLPEGAAPAGELPLDDGGRDLEPCRDLGDRAALELALDEHGVLELGQVVEREAQRRDGLTAVGGAGQRVVVRQPVGVGRAEALGRVEADLAATRGAAPLVDARAARDLAQPRADVLGLLLGGGPDDRPHRADEDVLHDVLRAPVVAQHPRGVRQDVGAMALEEDLERALVAGRREGHQAGVGRRRRREERVTAGGTG